MRTTFLGAVMTSAILGVLVASAAATEPVARGAYLVNTVMACGNCHTPMGPNGPDMSRALSGGLLFDTPLFTVTAPNITSDPTGLGGWSDDEIKTALTEGHRPDGTALAPIMPSEFYRVLTPADLDAVVAYLRTVPPVENTVPAPRYAGGPSHAVPGGQAPISAEEQAADPVRKGFYLVTIAHCMECHTNVAGLGPTAPTGGGGREIPGPWGVSVAANITSDPDAGLGAWADAEIVKAITEGISRDGHALMPPMGFAYYAGMTPEDLGAVVTYLRTLPPVH